jgi:hypothetical protein
MKKILPIIIIGILILSGLGAGAYQEKTESKIDHSVDSDIVKFSDPLIKENENGYLFINLDEANSNFIKTGEPILPKVNKKYVYPLGTKIKDIQVSLSDVKEFTLSKKIAIAPSPVTIINDEEIKAKVNDKIYTNNKLYPENQYTYSIHIGLEKNEHVVILNIQCYPIQYLPVNNLIYSAGKIDINVQYELPKEPVVFSDEYDMVIIAPEKFSNDLQPLINHKNSNGIITTLKTTESIYNEYPGRDQPEQIKYFIKDAIENWGISYVLLCGGKKSLLFGNWGQEGPKQSNDELWYVPVRYSNIPDSTGETGFLTDLYFSDIYKYENDEIVFEDWDSDGNDVFSEWSLDARDTLDLYPDVYVGRLACRNNYEVKIMVEKIIKYEAEGTDPSWFNKIVGVGGDSFDDRPPLGDDSFEGEERNQAAFDVLTEFTPVKVWASHKDTGEPIPSKSEILRTINDGCGFLYFAGHGNTALYRTYWYNDWSHGNATDPFDIYDMILQLKNDEKLPICVIGACHNSEFNVSFFNFLTSPLDSYPTPECWSWILTRKNGGGAIATIGYTGLEWVATYGWDNDEIPDPIQYFSGYIDNRFFYAYGVDGIEMLGEACGQAITDYIDAFPDPYIWDVKTPQQWCLLGDPSLKIGGYS